MLSVKKRSEEIAAQFFRSPMVKSNFCFKISAGDFVLFLQCIPEQVWQRYRPYSGICLRVQILAYIRQTSGYVDFTFYQINVFPCRMHISSFGLIPHERQTIMITPYGEGRLSEPGTHVRRKAGRGSFLDN